MSDWSDHANYNCQVTLRDGRQFKIYANWLHNEGLDQFKDWTCWAGAHRLMIDKNFAVFSGECKNDSLGSAIDGFDLLPYTTCKRDTCTGCTDDLMVSKHR